MGLKEPEQAHRPGPVYLPKAVTLPSCQDEPGLGDRARKVHLEAPDLAPDTPALLNNQGLVYFQRGALTRAVGGYQKTRHFQLDTQDASPHLGLVVCHPWVPDHRHGQPGAMGCAPKSWPLRLPFPGIDSGSGLKWLAIGMGVVVMIKLFDVTGDYC